MIEEQAPVGFEVALQMTSMTPEEEAAAEFDALLGAYGDVQIDQGINLDERRQRDELIFAGLRQLVTTVEGRGDVELFQSFMARIGEIACNHQHFADMAKTHNLFGNQPAEDHNHAEHGPTHHDEDEDDDEEDTGARTRNRKRR